MLLREKIKGIFNLECQVPFIICDLIFYVVSLELDLDKIDILHWVDIYFFSFNLYISFFFPWNLFIDVTMCRTSFSSLSCVSYKLSGWFKGLIWFRFFFWHEVPKTSIQEVLGISTRRHVTTGRLSLCDVVMLIVIDNNLLDSLLISDSQNDTLILL